MSDDMEEYAAKWREDRNKGTPTTKVPRMWVRNIAYGGALPVSASASAAWKAAVVAAGGTVSAARQTLVDSLLSSIAGLPVYRLWLHAAENTQSALIDVVNLGVASIVSTPTFAANLGYTTSATAYLDLGTPGASPYTQNSAMFGFAKRTNDGVIALIPMGATNTNALVLTYLVPKFSDTSAYIANNITNGVSVTAAVNTSGIFLLSRTAASGAGSTTLYQAGSSIATDTTASTGVPNQNFSLGGYKDSTGTFSNGGGAAAPQFSASFIGGGMTAGQVSTFNTALQTYLTAVGA